MGVAGGVTGGENVGHAALNLEIPVGTAIGPGDRYEIRDFLGRGGFGAVYRAHDREMDEEVALKVLPLVSKERFQSIRNEYKSRKRLRNLEHILGGETPMKGEYAGEPVIIYPMELADGGSLRQKIKEFSAIEDVAEREAAARDMLEQIIAGVQACHEAGIVHLDIKPENFLFHAERLRVTDFGIARGAGPGEYRDGTRTVSYTHLTLPTKRIV